MSKVKLIKNWIGRHKKFVIIGSVLFALLVAVVCGVTFSLSRIYGSAYDVGSIAKDIDKIKVGDTINYTANGYSDWKVLSIDKENHTIDIISKGPVGDLTFKREDKNRILNILQEEANKYMDGKYAIGARCVGTSKEESTLVDTLGYWTNENNGTCIGHSPNGTICFDDDHDFGNDYYPIVTLNVGDSSSLYVGDTYNYTLNGIAEWRILYVNDASSISIVPENEIYHRPFKGELFNFDAFMEKELSKFKDDNVISVKVASEEELEKIENIGIGVGCVFTGEIEREELSYTFDDNVAKKTYDKFRLHSMYCGYDDYEVATSYTSGFIPVVTLKYDKEYTDRKNADTELKIGDYVKYSANAYDAWKVLSIDKENQTAEIISSGVVKNLILTGKEDYDNYETLLQEAVNSYKVGDNAISVRSVNKGDFDNMAKAGLRNSAMFFLPTKKRYREYHDSGFYNSVQVGGWDSYGLQVYDTWYSLSFDTLSTMANKPDRNYTVAAGVYPVVTVKLAYIEKGKPVNNNEHKYVAEQKKANVDKNALTNEDLENLKEVTADDDSENGSNNDFSKLNYSISKLENSFEKVITSNNLILAFVVLTNGITLVAIMNFLRKMR